MMDGGIIGRGTTGEICGLESWVELVKVGKYVELLRRE